MSGAVHDVRVPTYPPHEMLHAIWSFSEAVFESSFLDEGLDTTLCEFWKFFLKGPWGCRHERYHGSPDSELGSLLPIVWHIDGAEFHRNCEFYIWSWSSLVADGDNDVWNVKYPFCVIPHIMMRDPAVKNQVMREMAHVMGWSHEVMAAGILPRCGAAGEALLEKRGLKAGQSMSGKYKGAFAGVKHDGKARKEVHLFRRYYQCMFICDSCFAVGASVHSPPALYYANWQPGALYMETRLDQATYEAIEVDPSPFMKIPGWTLAACFWDHLHVIWLGFARDLVGSVLVEFYTHSFVEAGSEEECYQRLTAMFRAWCATRGIKPVRGWFNKASLGITNNEFPELASWFKAVHIKIIVMWLADQAQVFTRQGSEHDDFRCVCLWSLAEYSRVLDRAAEHSVMLSSSAKRKALNAGFQFLRSYQWLACNARAHNCKLYFVRPKLHAFWHILVDCVAHGLNPVRVQCNVDESYMHTLKRIGKHCAGGNACMTAVLLRYRIGLAIKMEMRRRVLDVAC